MALKFNLGAKIALGIGSATTVGVGGYVANEYLSGTKITELLEKDELVLLAKGGDAGQWTKRWKEYIDKGDNKWNLSNYDTSSKNTGSAPENFKEACTYNSTKKVNDNQTDIYKEVAEFCTKGFAVSELIGKEEKIQLIAEGDSQHQKWKEAWGKYFDEVKSSDPLKLGNLESSVRTTVPSNYKTRCDEEKVKEVRNKKDPTYLTVKSWCTTNK
ncbi:hypothetical protein A6V39_05000 [Candidatus Mycoplasma haematobovis]|uniref:Uncharacterized protein n=1 Tax=Candidatus Mycoplasma haematobovis TaxID=432608 RepID=A0A1A9QCV1_9MOLU|nr:hypothetical protein [Candidatus Mycoplasma haematobovis]OAL09785.1 hypothetical protein A6V39_05000 [Candidatus Mycoplasma haematobovis]